MLVLTAVAARLVAAGLVTASAAAAVLAAEFQGICQPADSARRADDLVSTCIEQAIDQRDQRRGALCTLTGEQAGTMAELRSRLPALVGVRQRLLDGGCGGPFIEAGVEPFQDFEDDVCAVLGRRMLLASGQAVLVAAEDLEGLSAYRTRLPGLPSGRLALAVRTKPACPVPVFQRRRPGATGAPRQHQASCSVRKQRADQQLHMTWAFAPATGQQLGIRGQGLSQAAQLHSGRGHLSGDLLDDRDRKIRLGSDNASTMAAIGWRTNLGVPAESDVTSDHG
ncbi:hypothetical protein [Streptomyces mirabilis]|uniref:hypothetical protein n=1 Tax=Streptomyces mirabilis TaxID=68239 RepID=UPI0036E13510